MEGYLVSIVIFTAIFAIFGLGLNLQWGFTGLLNFGHVAFMAIGAYATVLLAEVGVPLWIAAIVGMILAALLGLLIGASTLRLREDYLAIVTIGVSEMIRLIALNEEWLTEGSFGLQGFALPLEDFDPPAIVRFGMIAILTAILGLGGWQLWRNLRQRLKSIPSSSLIRSSLLVLGYLVSLGLILSVFMTVMRSLNQANLLPPWAASLVLVVGLGAIAWFYNWLARQMTKRFSAEAGAWSGAIALLTTTAITLTGLWVFGYLVSALYTYRSPTKTGLMFISIVLTAIVYWSLERLVRSPWGRVLKAIREDEQVAKALGKNVFWYKLQSLMLGGMLAGLAGALYAWQLTTVYPDNFMPLVTFNAWTIVVLGGAGSNAGTLLGAAIYWAYQNGSRFILEDIVPLTDAQQGAFRIMLIGLLLMVLMMWRPQGILGKKEELTLGR
ncbi:branched-chain amino acid ABC transporter permease [Microcoleus sp. FACHB-1515]|nr:branched-chain amino acid ABC transporter permease [Microcoleus sp. FACHB-1515]